MQRLVLALVSLLLVTGCIGAQKTEDAPATEPLTSQAVPEEAPAEETASSASPSSSSSSSSASNSSSPAATSSSSSSPPPPAPPAPPKPTPWNLTATAKLGWAVAAGVRADPLGQAAEQGQTDAEHCPDASFTLPADTSALTFTTTGAPATPGEPEAGAYRFILTAPDGTETTIDPTPPSGPTPTPTTVTLAKPLAGPWTIHAEPLGPAVSQAWDVQLDAEGESLAAPLGLALATTCAA